VVFVTLCRKREGTVDMADEIESTDVVEDVLVEEVSIDGMCGVY
jgi:mycofactocin precursor